MDEEGKVLTGIDRFKNKKPVEAIIFSDNTCPRCGETLKLVVKDLMNIPISIRYECDKCKYICPIKYTINGNRCTENACDEPDTSPLYDRSIYNFLERFGED